MSENTDVTIDEFDRIIPVRVDSASAATNSYADGLRELAKFVEFLDRKGHPVTCPGFWASDKREFLRWARLLGSFEKKVSDSVFYLTKHFSGGVTFQVYTSRNTICKQVLVREDDVPEVTILAHKVPVYRWDCSENTSLLGAEDEE